MTESKQTMRTASIVIVAFVVACVALFFGRELFVPIAIAMVFSLIFRPVVRAMERIRIPKLLGAAVVVLTILGIFTFAGWLLSQPVQDLLHDAPQRLHQAAGKLDRIRKPFQIATTVASAGSEQAEPAPQDGRERSAAAAAPPQSLPQSLSFAPSAIAATLGTTASFLTQIVEAILLLFLLLSTGDLFLHKLVKVLPRIPEKHKAITAVHAVEVAVMRYVVTITIINFCQACVIGTALWLLQVPNPALWAIGAFVLEFIPYLGGAIMIVMLSISALATFDTMAHALAVPATYLLITTTQNSLISPFAYGKRLKLNPVAVLVGVMFWWFLWGVAGAFLAVPIMATAKIICDRVESLKSVGEFLSE